MQLAERGAQDLAAPAEHGGGDDGVAADADVEGPVGAGIVEAVGGVAVRGVDCDGVAEGLEGEGGVEDEAFGAADAEVRVEEDDAAGVGGGGGGAGEGHVVGGHDLMGRSWPRNGGFGGGHRSTTT